MVQNNSTPAESSNFLDSLSNFVAKAGATYTDYVLGAAKVDYIQSQQKSTEALNTAYGMNSLQPPVVANPSQLALDKNTIFIIGGVLLLGIGMYVVFKK